METHAITPCYEAQMIRLFAAIAVPDDIGEPLTAHMHGLEGARWRPLEALHITLRFFGDVTEPMADDIDSELSLSTSTVAHRRAWE